MQWIVINVEPSYYLNQHSVIDNEISSEASERNYIKCVAFAQEIVLYLNDKLW